MHHCRRALALALTLIAVTSALAQSRSDPAEWAPADAAFYFGIADVQNFMTDLERTSQMRMHADPEIRKALGDQAPAQFFERFRQELARALNVPDADLKKLFRGPAVFYGRVNSEKKEVSALVAGVGDAALARKSYDQMLQRLAQIYTSRETSSDGAATIEEFSRDKDSAAADDDAADDPFAGANTDLSKAAEKLVEHAFSPDFIGDRVALCLTSDRWIVASNAAEVKALLAVDKARSFSSTPAFKKLGELKPAGSLRGYVNLATIAAQIKNDDSERGELAQRGAQVMGMDRMRELFANAKFGGDSLDLKLELMLTFAGAPAGFDKLLRMPNMPVAPPAGVPADAVAYLAYNSSLLNIIEGVLNPLDLIQPGVGTMARGQLENLPLGGEPLNVLNDCIAHLEGPIFAHLAFVKPYDSDEAAHALLQMRHKNKAAIQQFMTRAKLPERDLNGMAAYSSPVGRLVVAIGDERVLIGPPSAIEAATKAGEDGLKGAARFKAAQRWAPQEASFFVYADMQQLLRVLIETKEAGNASYTEAADQLLKAVYGLPPLEAAKLRPFLKYAGTNIAALTTTPDGVKLTWLILKPDAPAGGSK